VYRHTWPLRSQKTAKLLPSRTLLRRRALSITHLSRHDSGVLIKMGLFTLAMVVLPIGSYFVSRDYYFGCESVGPRRRMLSRCTDSVSPEQTANLTGAGMTAAIVANLILVAFVVIALREDSGQRAQETKKEDPKAQ
jgi:hypothetical protein